MQNGRKALRIEIFILLLVIIFLVTYTESTRSDTYEDYQKLESLVTRWAPIIWLAPGERFMPLGVTEFLDNVYAASDDGTTTIRFGEGRQLLVPGQTQIPHGEASQMLYLHTKRNLDSLKNSTSFIHGVNPQTRSVPIYVTVRYCDSTTLSSERTFYKPTANFLNDILYGQIDRLSMSMRSRMSSGVHFTVTYWMFYPFNEGKEVCFLGNFPAPFIFNTCFGKKRIFGNHVGDFEHLTLSFSGNSHPDELYLSIHDTGAYYTYDKIKHLFRFRAQRPVDRNSSLKSSLKSSLHAVNFPQLVRLTGDRPVLYAARGSHGLWATPGDHLYVRVPRLYDYTGYGSPWKTWKDVKIYRLGLDAAPFWMGFEGKWGNPKANCLLFRKLGICELSDGPQGVLMRNQDFQC